MKIGRFIKRHSKLFHQALLALMLGIGALVVESVVVTLLVELLVPVALGVAGSIFGFDPDRSDATSLDFTSSGEPYLEHWQKSGKITDLDGNPIDVARRSHRVELYNGPVWATNRPSFDWQDWHVRISQYSITDHGIPVGFWYLVHDAQNQADAYLVGYQLGSNQRIGFIGTAGFRREELPRAEWFALTSQESWYTTAEVEGVVGADRPYTVVLNCGAQVVAVDLETQQIRTLLGDLKTPIRSMAAMHGNRPSPLILLTDEAIDLFDPDGRRRTFALPPELRQRDLTVAVRSDGGLTVKVDRPLVFDSLTTPVSIYVLAADGTVSPPREVALQNRKESFDETFLVQVLIPIASQVPIVWHSAEEWHRYEGIHSRAEFTKLLLWRDRWQELLAVLLGVALATICYRRLARYRATVGQRIFWTLFVFLFGIPGWFGFRYCRRWPVVESCPACHQPSPRVGEACGVCGRELPSPTPLGTEIFA